MSDLTNSKDSVTVIKNCRLCKSSNLQVVVNLGDQALTGVFPKSKSDDITSGPLRLVWCHECSLLQLEHSYPLDEMYGANYGYRSGLNKIMVEHLSSKVSFLCQNVELETRDSVLDIGSNDATLLKAYKIEGIKRIGIDPTGKKFASHYSNDIKLIADFFSADEFPNEKFKIITSISMFYDLENPQKFVSDIAQVLHKDGIWHFEQSYMPSMLRQNSYDTICHEHLEYYALTPVKKMLDACDLKIIDVKMNSVNGGSFAITACHQNANFEANNSVIQWMLEWEDKSKFNSPLPFLDFEKRIFDHRLSLQTLIHKINEEGKIIHCYGASTKGNVLLQFCGFNEDNISHVAEINPDKFGCFTPGTSIPIISAEESEKMSPDYYLVLPWHFRDGIIRNEKQFLEKGGRFIFPFPEIEIF